MLPDGEQSRPNEGPESRQTLPPLRSVRHARVLTQPVVVADHCSSVMRIFAAIENLFMFDACLCRSLIPDILRLRKVP